MELHQIRYFLALCETLNFTRAAELCNVTQPALTRAIRKLEDELGGPLFRRERAMSHLTDLGRLMQPHLQSVLDEVDAAKVRATGFGKLEEAPIQIGIMCTIGPARLVGLFSRVQREMPGVAVQFEEAPAGRLIEKLLSGELDVALVASAAPFPDRIDTRPLYEERFVVGFPPGHRFERQNAIRIADMDQVDYLSRTDCEFLVHLRGLLKEAGAKVNIRFRSPREDWIQSMIMAGMGCAFMPEYITVTPGLPTRPVIDPDVVRQVCLATVAGRRFSPPLAAFMRLAARHDWNLPAGVADRPPQPPSLSTIS
ncbi:MAG: LysR family transcriptional regulator [Alphaproteobacteria bacterium]|nr:LysR family transcriptional regulator [Alphaproteobacteria bacterium]